MPELPEVETIRRQLEGKILDKKIVKVEIKLAKLVNLPIKKFESLVAGKKVEEISRRAKLLIWKLSDNLNLVFHLKMTGQVIWADKKQAPNNYTSAIFSFSGGDRVFFNDWRKFGWIRLYNNQELEKLLSEYGPEPFDKKFDAEKFRLMLLKKKRIKIKPLLMDQKFLAGVGNIYAQEACFCAKIHPERKAGSLNDEEIKLLYNCLKKILIEAIKYKGSSVDAYVDAYGKRGGFVPRLKIYGRRGKNCVRCGNKIEVKKIGGRGTYFCGKCQE